MIKMIKVNFDLIFSKGVVTLLYLSSELHTKLIACHKLGKVNFFNDIPIV